MPGHPHPSCSASSAAAAAAALVYSPTDCAPETIVAAAVNTRGAEQGELAAVKEQPIADQTVVWACVLFCQG